MTATYHRGPEGVWHMRRAPALGFTMALLLLSAPSFAIDRGDQLLWECQGMADTEMKAASGKLHCAGYLSGFVDSYRVMVAMTKMPDAFCLPRDGVSSDQLMRVVVKWLEAHPEQLHETARGSVFIALQKAFPCQEGKPARP